MLSKKKKIFIICSFAVLLIATGVLNVLLNNSISANSVNGGNITVGNFFETYREDRTDTRDQEILYYDAIATSASSSADAIAEAELKRQELVELMEMELIIEGLIKAKGFEDAVVSTTTSSINVIIKAEELTSSEVAQIVDVIQG